MPVRVFTPATSTGCLVWAHGGSWVSGSVEEWHLPCADLAALSGWTIVSVEYRLAPAHRHPAALQDILTALTWAGERLTGEGCELPLAVGGDSAGGTLAASAALARRDSGLRLNAQVLAYPPLDPACESSSYHRDPSAFPSRDRLLAAWRELAGMSDPSHSTARGYLTPWEVEDLAGLAPAILAVGSKDPVRDDVYRYADCLTEAGVPVSLRTFQGQGHGLFVTPHTGADRPKAFHRWIAAEIAASAEVPPIPEGEPR